jgi:hypothetical protein
MIRRSTLMHCLRTEARAALHALLFLLLVPVLHPLAEARALQQGMAEIICSTFGVTSQAVKDRAALPDDAPDCLACALAATALPPVVGSVAPAALEHHPRPSPFASATVRPALLLSAAPRAPPALS